MTVAKTVNSGSLSTFSSVGDTITFDYLVTNSGNTTLAGPVTITDDKIPGTLTCQAGSLAPTATVSCSQTWTATQADLDAQSVTNTATGHATFGGNPVTSPTSQQTVTAVINSSLAMTKTIVAPLPTSFSVGQTLNYSYSVTNNGNVTVAPKAPAASIVVNDNLVGAVNCGAGSIAPTASVSCAAAYVITANDILLGSATNTATATGSFGGSDVVSPSQFAIFPIAATPALTITKVADKALLTTADLGTNITYTYQVTNNGNTDFISNINITDDKIGTFLCLALNPATFPVNATTSCTATYTVTQVDLDAGFVTNSAFAGSDFAGTPVQSPAQVVTVPATIAPALSLAKTFTGPNPATLGDTVTYTLVVTNSGQQTINNVQVSDPMFPGLSCTAASLAPTGTLNCGGGITHVVTQVDIDAQTLVNNASVRGAAPGGATITGTATATVPLAIPTPAVTVTKAVTPVGSPDYQFVGQNVDFQITVQNSGNVTLSSTTVTDSIVPGSCAIGSLAPGASDNSCVFSYTVTQADVNNGTHCQHRQRRFATSHPTWHHQWKRQRHRHGSGCTTQPFHRENCRRCQFRQCGRHHQLYI